MTDRANIKLPVDEFDKHNERRQEMGLSWTEYVDGQAPDPPDVELPKSFGEKLDKTLEAAKEATNAAQNAEQAIEQVTQG